VIRITIIAEAYLAICSTLPLGSVMYEPEVNADGERQIWLEPAVVDKLDRLRRPGESYSDVIMRLSASDTSCRTGPDAASLRSFVYSSLGDRVMLDTAWIDWAVDTQGLRSLLPRLP
jgi:hypothetical protein